MVKIWYLQEWGHDMKKAVQLLCFLVILFAFVSCSKKEKENGEMGEYITLSIDEINEDYFLAQHPWASPLRYKVFYELKDDYCVGDYVTVFYEEMTLTEEGYFEVIVDSLEASDFELKEGVAYKPVIYLYPQVETNVTVTLDYNGVLTHTYPSYEDGWEVTAYPDGSIIDNNGIEYPYLFWEGESNIEYDTDKGFCVSGEDTEEFLRKKLKILGLNNVELEDFLDFWVPFMKKNPYNKISFQTTNYTENAKLIINPKPDSILRVYMVFEPLEEYVEIEEQALDTFKRIGFAVIEWGGSIYKEK